MGHSSNELISSLDGIELMNPFEHFLMWLAANQNFVDTLVEVEGLEHLPHHYDILSDALVVHIPYVLV